MSGLRVLCCYAGLQSLHPATEASLTAFAPEAERIDVSGNPYSYFGEIAERWTGRDDLIIIEQDIQIYQHTIPEFLYCPEPWCVFPYQVRDRETLLDFGLGCTRFRAEAIQAVGIEDILSRHGECDLCNGTPGCWRHLDCLIAWAMQAAGIMQCVHWPGVMHHNPQVTRSLPAHRMRWQQIDPDARDAR